MTLQELYNYVKETNPDYLNKQLMMNSRYLEFDDSLVQVDIWEVIGMSEEDSDKSMLVLDTEYYATKIR